GSPSPSWSGKETSWVVGSTATEWACSASRGLPSWTRRCSNFEDGDDSAFGCDVEPLELGVVSEYVGVVADLGDCALARVRKIDEGEGGVALACEERKPQCVLRGRASGGRTAAKTDRSAGSGGGE